jgi:phosphomannomutase
VKAFIAKTAVQRFSVPDVSLRTPNTEPVIRLNVEAQGDRELIERETAEIVRLIEGIC